MAATAHEHTRFHTFVSNRICAIREATEVAHWRYVNTKMNPADAASRGQRADAFLKNTGWIHGPERRGVATVPPGLYHTLCWWPRGQEKPNHCNYCQRRWQAHRHTDHILLQLEKTEGCSGRVSEAKGSSKVAERKSFSPLSTKPQSLETLRRPSTRRWQMSKPHRADKWSLWKIWRKQRIPLSVRTNSRAFQRKWQRCKWHHLMSTDLIPLFGGNAQSGRTFEPGSYARGDEVPCHSPQKQSHFHTHSTWYSRKKWTWREKPHYLDKILDNQGQLCCRCRTGYVSLAERELREALSSLNQKKVEGALFHRGVQWSFNPPGASHHGGEWERLIRSVRKVLHSVLKQQTLDDHPMWSGSHLKQLPNHHSQQRPTGLGASYPKPHLAPKNQAHSTTWDL